MCVIRSNGKPKDKLVDESNRTASYGKAFKSTIFTVRGSIEDEFIRNNQVKGSRGGLGGRWSMFKGGT
jgi:hypothetical protein